MNALLRGRINSLRAVNRNSTAISGVPDVALPMHLHTNIPSFITTLYNHNNNGVLFSSTLNATMQTSTSYKSSTSTVSKNKNRSTALLWFAIDCGVESAMSATTVSSDTNGDSINLMN